MKIRYTRKTSGYISLLLGIITLKVFLEALWLDRGPVPGLSFLFYALIFYSHYSEERITKYSVLCYQFIKEIQWNSIPPYIVLTGKNLGDLVENYFESENMKPLLRKIGSKLDKGRVMILYSSKDAVKKKDCIVADIKKWGKENSEDLFGLLNEFKIMYKDTSVEVRNDILSIYGSLMKKWFS